MKLIQLEYFVRIVEEQSFTKAAEKLFISQPALSKAIQSMEKELKVSLFSRKPGVATLTEDGNTVYKYAKDILSYCSNRTAELIARLGKAKEPVKFGLPPSVGSVFFSNVLLEYNEKYPQIDLQIFEGTSKQIEAMIVNSQLDLGVVVEPYENPDMELKTVFRSDAVLAVGGESILCPIVVSGLSQAKALSRRNDDPEQACRPFDLDRDGFVIGEGGGALLIETEEHALARGAKIHAVLAGYANTSDAHHVTAPCPDGEGASRCMKLALKRAGMQPSDIGYINAHGTSTPLGDKA